MNLYHCNRCLKYRKGYGLGILFIWGFASLSIAGLFPDKNLEAAVRAYVFEKKNNDKPIEAKDVSSISTITATGKGIKDLTGIENCWSLGELRIVDGEIVDLKSLGGLSGLQSLTLAGNRIESIAALKTCESLQYIDLGKNQVKDLSPLSGLEKLFALYIADNKIADPKGIEGCKNLYSLDLSNNPINQLKPIGACKKLTSLSLANAGLKNLDGLVPPPQLNFLNLRGNPLENIQPVVDWALQKERAKEPVFLRLYIDQDKRAGDKLGGQLKKLESLGIRINPKA